MLFGVLATVVVALEAGLDLPHFCEVAVCAKSDWSHSKAGAEHAVYVQNIETYFKKLIVNTTEY